MLQRQFSIPTTIIYTQDDGTKNIFIRNEELGRGSFAAVYRVRLQNTNETYAMKIISKLHCPSLKGKQLLEKVKNEIDIQSKLNHPNIVQYKYSFSDDFNFYIALEYLPGKNIRDYLQKSENSRLTEPETRKIINDVIKGLIYLHSHKITHYDVKLENFIIDSEGNVKIADFGLSSFHKDEGENFTVLFGSPNYLSPEIIRKDKIYDSCKADIWAIGISTFILLTGKAPFEGSTKEATIENIKKCLFYFSQKVPLSNEAKDFIKLILKDDPKERPTAKDLLNHPFLTKKDSDKVQLYKSYHLPQLNRIPNSIQKVQIIDNNKKLPQIINPSARSIRAQSPRASNLNLNLNSKISCCCPSESKHLNNIYSDIKKMFVIPSHFISRYCFHKDNLCYLLGDGTVGVNFKDKSRIVLSPNEVFIQFYDNPNSHHEVIDVNNDIQNIENQQKKNVALFTIKVAQKFKNNRFSYDITRNDFDPSVPLYNIKYFVKNDDSILFKLNDKNIQVNFKDYQKMIIFWDTKKMCFFRNIKEKCNLLDLKYVASMNPNSDEVKKLKKSKELLSNLALTI